MTEKLAALKALSRMPGDTGAKALEDFYQTFKSDTNVVDTWLTLQASIPSDDAAGHVRGLLKHEAFDLTNPNKVRALMTGFLNNTKAFHNKDGSGYKLLADVVIQLNDVNAHTAAGIVGKLTQFNNCDALHQKLMLEQLKRIMATPKLNTQVKDIVGKALATAPKLQTVTASPKLG